MAQVIWSSSATHDLEAIAEFIAKDSPLYAALTITTLYKAVDRLQQFPLSGRITPELQLHSRREIVVGNYRILYRIHNDVCEVTTILHSKQDLIKHLTTK